MARRTVVVGGGLFGCWAALVLASRGHTVVVVEQDHQLLNRASLVNQARLHTGLHYPRSLLTASEALSSYQRFRSEFPAAVHDFTQMYAIARHGSKTSAAGFERFIDRLGLDAQPVDASRWFRSSMVESAWIVEEPSFDAGIIRDELSARLRAEPRIDVVTGVPVASASANASGVSVSLADGREIRADEMVIATYAALNPVRQALGLEPLTLQHELTEVVLGTVSGPLQGRGFTIMDGPFWSMMPFGKTGEVTLTSVGLTPVLRADSAPEFPCQLRREDCTPLTLAECSTCPERPRSLAGHQVQQMRLFLTEADHFEPVRSIWTVKTILRIAEVDDARPTVVRREPDLPVWTVFSGKVSTVFDLEEALG